MTKEERAILDTIAYAEGTLGLSNNGYDIIFGNKQIIGWTETTNIVHGGGDWIQTYKGGKSTAAGRYQFIYKSWLSINNDVNKELSKVNQDFAGLKKVNQRLKSNRIDKRPVTISELTNETKFNIFLQKCAPEWASLPLTKDFTTKDGVKKTSGFGYYDGQNSHKTANELYKIFMMAYNLY